MRVLLFDHNLHLTDAKVLLQSRSMSPDLVQDLPLNGVIVFKDHTPLAMGFLRLVEGPYAMLDSYISNKEALKEDRSEALDLVTSALLELSVSKGKFTTFAFTDKEQIYNRAVKHNMVPSDHKFLAINRKEYN